MIRKAPRSLTVKLLIATAVAQIVVPIIGMIVWMLFSPYVTWTDVAAASAQRRVLEALDQDLARDVLMIRPTSDLTAYAAARPGFRYAVMRSGRVAEGSDPELKAMFERLAPLVPRNGQLEISLPEGAQSVQIASGHVADDAELVFATTGNQFRFEDLEGYVRVFLPELLPLLAPSFLAAAIALPLLVAAATRPLRRAAREAEGVAFDNLAQRLSEQDVPTEAIALVRAVNAALARLESGARRQRIFYANAAHELRTPVAILQARLDATPEIARGDELRRDVARIVALIDQLLALERANAGVSGEEEIDLFDCARAIVADRAPLAIHSSKSLEFAAEGPTPIIRGNVKALESVLTNLIDNAVRAEPIGGCVHVRAGPGPVVVIIDHGAGIPESDHAVIFEPFWRKDDRTPGVGLGLSIVREALRVLNARIQVEETEGGGASFRISFQE